MYICSEQLPCSLHSVHTKQMFCSGKQEVFPRDSSKRVWGSHLYTQNKRQLLTTLKPDTWPAKALSLHLKTWPVEPEIFWTFPASWTRTDALDPCSVNGRSRCVKLSPWLCPSCGFHLSSKLCWSALAEQHPSAMYRVLTTAGFVLCKEDMSRTVQSA